MRKPWDYLIRKSWIRRADRGTYTILIVFKLKILDLVLCNSALPVLRFGSVSSDCL